MYQQAAVAAISASPIVRTGKFPDGAFEDMVRPGKWCLVFPERNTALHHIVSLSISLCLCASFLSIHYKNRFQTQVVFGSFLLLGREQFMVGPVLVK